MKIRNGFVSNSSSSSFIITADKVNEYGLNTVKVAIEFLKEQRESLKEYIKIKEVHNRYRNAFKWLEKNKETKENPPISFNSCNYETFIWKRTDGCIQINTCNNVNWDNACNKVMAEHYGDGADGGQWEDCPQININEDKYTWKEPDMSKFIDLDDENPKWPNLIEEIKLVNRFIAILEEE